MEAVHGPNELLHVVPRLWCSLPPTKRIFRDEYSFKTKPFIGRSTLQIRAQLSKHGSHFLLKVQGGEGGGTPPNPQCRRQHRTHPLHDVRSFQVHDQDSVHGAKWSGALVAEGGDQGHEMLHPVSNGGGMNEENKIDNQGGFRDGPCVYLGGEERGVQHDEGVEDDVTGDGDDVGAVSVVGEVVKPASAVP